jgi:hypothetical protein
VPDALEETAAREAERNLGDDAVAQDLLRSLDDVIGAVTRLGIPYVVVGGIASSVLGRPRFTHDIDLLVRPEDARAILDELAPLGFATEERAPHWLFKAYRDGIETDLIFRSTGDIYLDDDILRHAVEGEFEGRRLLLMGREDLVVSKALAHQEHSPRHWFDALALIASHELDWTYLLQRARRGPKRVASLLLYAQSNDLVVPDWVLPALLGELVGTGPDHVAGP